MSQTPTDAPTQAFLDHRELMFSVVYGMLGSVADTDDVLQETWLSWHRRASDPTADPVQHTRSYLVRVAVNHALNRQETIRNRRETYPGPWLPEPVVWQQEDRRDVAAESVSLALLVVLETLSPLERAVFVLHEVFGFRYGEVARILGRSPAATRQLGHRARRHVRTRRPRYPAEPRVHEELVERFVAAALGGDLAALLEMLAPGVTMTVDGGGTRRAPRRPVHGRDEVTRLIGGLSSGTGLDVRFRTVNNDPAAVLLDGDTVFAVMVLDLTPDGQQVNEIYTIVNPDKLSSLHAPVGSPGTRGGQGS